MVTGGGSGIGRALAERFAAEGAHGVAVVDHDAAAARAVAERIGGMAIVAELTRESEVRRVVAEAVGRYGPIDLYCSNAGIVEPVGGYDVPDEGWQEHWNIHVMAHVWAARCLVPEMARRGRGYLLNTASACAPPWSRPHWSLRSTTARSAGPCARAGEPSSRRRSPTSS